jgi:two-component system OmpR family sensor kinase
VGRLFWKFFFFIWIFQFAGMVAVGSSFWLKERNRERQLAQIDMSPPAAFQIESAAATLQYGGVAALQSLVKNMRHHPIYAVDEKDREILGRTVDKIIVENTRRVLLQHPASHTVRELTASDGHSYLLFVPRIGPAQESSRPPPGEGTPDHRGGAMFPIKPMIAAMLGSLAAAALLAWHLAEPIRSLRLAFKAASSGNLDLRVAAQMGKRRDELADLGCEFDRMATRIKALMEGQRRLLHDVSHELRSPLARL